ncbi:MAG: right-handed parallel beta-helix repeat-containing protein, partial [Bacteroidales bacterium]|nr:right-handed parallel beta-helix repeat-containing protein [Bacteroidales bacterium]
MKQFLYTVSLIITGLLMAMQASAFVVKSGNVSGEYWHNTDTYYVNGNLTVDAGTTFEIQAGTRVKFAPGTSLNVYGTIIANGNSTSNIIFTSMDDDSVGEIIPGSDGNPNPGDWERIFINGYSSSDGIGLFEHVVIRYAGGSYGNIYFYYAGTASLQNCIIRHSNNYGVGDYGGNLDADNCDISYNTTDGINSYSSSPAIDNCHFDANGNYAAYIDACSGILPYTNNTGSGNQINAFGISGTIGQDLTLSESLCGFPYVLVGQITQAAGYTLTIPAGEIIKCIGSGAMLQVNGTLNAIGTASQNIIFTSLYDDA